MDNKKNVIVTGGYRGIGRAITEQLLRGGYRVYICARSEDKLKECVQDLSSLGEIDYFVLDLADRQAIKDFCENWNQEIYALINNAGIFKEERLDEEDTGAWDLMVDLNLSGLYFLTKGLLPRISKPGRILNISSQLGNHGREEMGIYSATKHAVN
jgi:NAD(P)-dependent dehydrogenase (short-subunit alcohol dehydrogenase family)